MSTKKKKKKGILHSTFYRVYFALVAVALIGIVLGTLWLNGALRDYESAQPVYVAQGVARLFETADYDRIFALDTSAQGLSEEDREFYVQSLNALAAGKQLAWSEVFSASADERRYGVTLDGEKFASFTLVPSGRVTPKGNRLWTLGSVTTNVAVKEPEPTPEPTPTPAPLEAHLCSITAPQGCLVTVNGAALDEQNARTTPKPLYDAQFLPSGVESPVLVEYVYETTDQLIEVAVTDENGAAMEVSHDDETAYTWKCALPEDAAAKEQYSEAVFSLAQKLAKFTSRDVKQSTVLKLCASGSPAEAIFENLSNQYFTPHTSVSFRNGEITDFYILSQDCFTCHVSFDFVMKTSKGEVVYPTEYTFCVIRQGEKGKLYNLSIY